MSLPSVDISWLDSTPPKKRRRRQGAPTKKPRGRPAVRDKFPGVVEAASDFVQSNGFKAHRRRQEEIGVCGSSLSHIRDHLQSTVPGLQEQHPNLNVRTIAHWMHPPNKAHKAAQQYKGLIKARIPSKDNSARKASDNSHFYSARVRYSMEMASKFSEHVMVYSADNKNKVRVGDNTLAVDRRIRINRFFPMNDAPCYMDHDFPTPGYLLTPSGYLELEPSSATTLDHIGREHFVLPQKSSSHVFLRSPHSPNNVASHLNDFHHILSPPTQKPVLVLVVDGGSDFNVNFAVNEMFYATFFKDSNLDALMVTSYCPGDSAMNPIEHLWAPCTRALTSVYLSSTLDGEDRPPSQQSALTAQERKSKEHDVFDNAMALIKDVYWGNLHFAGHKVNVDYERSGSPPTPYGSDYDDVKKVVNGSTRLLKANPNVHNHFKFTHSHMDRRIGTIIFTKCTKPSCLHCTNHPTRAPPELMSCLRDFPSPSPSTSHDGHFKTFMEALSSDSVLPCEHLPSFLEKDLRRCGHPGCKYVYTSKKDVDDHRRKVH